MRDEEFRCLLARIERLRARIQDLYDSRALEEKERMLSVSQELDRLIAKFHKVKSARDLKR